MIDNLEGGTISLEHNYVVGPLARRVGHETLYEGVQDPFERPIWIHVYDFLHASTHDRLALTERQLRAAERSREVDSFGLLLVVDHGELEEGVPFLISERCSGPSLEELLAREGTLSPEETAQLILRLADLIDPLHRHNRYHGSISPHWIVVPDEEMNRARLGHTHLSLSLKELRQIGSPLPFELLAMLAPELIEEPDADGEAPPSGSRQADIYALGVLAYRCLAGTHPVLSKARDGDAALKELRDAPRQPLTELGVDEEISEVIMRALSVNPAQRWSNAPAMSQALARAAGLLKDPAPASPAEDAAGDEPSTQKSALAARETSLDEEPTALATDRRATITGIALLALCATNVFWLVWTFSSTPDQRASDSDAFTTLSVTSDLPAVSVSDVSAPEGPPSILGDTPLSFDLPRSVTPLELKLQDSADASGKIIRVKFLQTPAKPMLEMHITRESPTQEEGGGEDDEELPSP